MCIRDSINAEYMGLIKIKQKKSIKTIKNKKMKFQLIVLFLVLLSANKLNSLTCNTGEFLNANSNCQLCTSITPNCLACYDGNGTCEICKGFIPAVSGVCGCEPGLIQTYDQSSSSFTCSTAQVAQSYWTNNSWLIEQMTENLTLGDYGILYSAALGVNGGASYVCPALETIRIAVDYGIAEIYTQDKQLHALAAADVLVAIAYNSQGACFDSILNTLYSSSNLARFNYTNIKIMALIGEYHGIVINKINQFDFSTFDYRAARILMTQQQIALDNWKNYMLVYVADSGYLKSYHFSNIYIKFAGVNRSSFTSGLLTNNYVISVSSTALQKFPANQSIYFVQTVYTQDPLAGHKYSRNVVSNLETIQFYISSSYSQANSYLSSLSGNQVQLTMNMNQVLDVVLDYWNEQQGNWLMNSDQCSWNNMTATCNVTSLSVSNTYALVENQGQKQ
eukprot:TRINITY_DN31_c0_g1_i2.p1 TRINITY_DN31_c0_g1~~TRINITY_DN31_c0_g1_i2.p1  ORF type:complete len:449 (-),score=61.43 TRINITY_DN31_c0_g1_i2:136-1482(-)